MLKKQLLKDKTSPNPFKGVKKRESAKIAYTFEGKSSMKTFPNRFKFIDIELYVDDKKTIT